MGGFGFMGVENLFSCEELYGWIRYVGGKSGLFLGLLAL